MPVFGSAFILGGEQQLMYTYRRKKGGGYLPYKRRNPECFGNLQLAGMYPHTGTGGYVPGDVSVCEGLADWKENGLDEIGIYQVVIQLPDYGDLHLA